MLARGSGRSRQAATQDAANSGQAGPPHRWHKADPRAQSLSPILSAGRLPGRRLGLVRSSGRATRLEGRPVRIPHEANFVMVDAAFSYVMADIDHPDVTQRAIMISRIRMRDVGLRMSSASFDTTQLGFCKMTRAKAKLCFSSSVNCRSHRSSTSSFDL